MVPDPAAAIRRRVWTDPLGWLPMDVLGAIGSAATTVALLILVYTQAKPAMNRWPTVKYLRSYYELTFEDLITPEQARALPWARRLRRAWRDKFVIPFVARMMTRQHRIHLLYLIDQLKQADQRMVESFIAPQPADVDPLVVEAVSLSRDRRERRRIRRLKRVHRGVRCARGCGTKYGERRSDHSFIGGGGIEGGWFCPSADSCVDRQKATGDHFCGMCLKPFAVFDEAEDSADASD